MKNMTSLTNILRGVSAFLSLSRYRLVNESLSSRLRLVAIFCLLMTGGVGNAWGKYIYLNTSDLTGWESNSATFKLYPGTGSDVTGVKVYDHMWRFDVPKADGTMYFKRFSSDGNTLWNEFPVDYNASYNVYKVTSWSRTGCSDKCSSGSYDSSITMKELYLDVHTNWYDGGPDFWLYPGTGSDVKGTVAGTNLYLFSVPNASGTIWFKRYKSGSHADSDKWDEFSVAYSSTYNTYEATGWKTGVASYNVKLWEKPNYIYFDNSQTNWSTTKKYFVIGHDKPSYYSSTYEFTSAPITNTKLFYYNNSANTYRDATYFAFLGSGTAFNSGSWSSSNLSTAAKYTAAYTDAGDLTWDKVYLFVPANGDNGASLTKNTYSNTSGMNNTQTIAYALSTDDGNTFTAMSSGTVPGQLYISAYKFKDGTYNSVTNSSNSVTISSGSTGTYSASVPAAYTGQTTLTKTASSGYTWVGWYDAVNDGNEVTLTDNKYYPTSAQTIYARYKTTTWGITYKDNGNAAFSGAHVPEKVANHTYLAETSLNKACKSGYVFDGWFYENDCSGTAKTAIGATDFTSAPTLYAKWTAMNLGSLANNTLYKAEDMVVDGLTISGTETFRAGVSTNNLFNLLGSGTSNATGGPMGAKTESASIGGESFTNALYFKGNAASASTSGTTLPTSRAIQFVVSATGTLDIYCNNPSHIYLIKSGSSTAAIAASGTSEAKTTVVVTAGTYYLYSAGSGTNVKLFGLKFRPTFAVTAAVSPVGNGSATSGSARLHAGETTTITASPNDGYKVTSWAVSGTGASIDPSGTSNATSTTLTMGTANATVTATLTPIDYTITYYLDGGTNYAGAPTSYNIETATIVLGTPTKEHYHFDGWTDGSGDPITQITEGSTGNVSLTAHWTRLPMVYLKNTMNWPNAYVSFYKGNYWDADHNPSHGTGSYRESPFYVADPAAMTYNSITGLFEFECPDLYAYTYASFTKMQQINYGNFADNNEVIYINDAMEYGKVVVVDALPTTTRNTNVKYYESNVTLVELASGEGTGWFIPGGWTSWETRNAEFSWNTSPNVQWTKELTHDSDVEFKVYNHGVYFGFTSGLVKFTESNRQFVSGQNNCKLRIGAEGTYTFDYNTSNNQLSVTYPAVFAVAGGFNSWSESANPMSGTTTRTASITLTPGDQELKIISNGSYYGYDDQAITGTTTKTLDIDEGNLTVKADVYPSGTYDLSYVVASKALTITFPTAYAVTFDVGTVKGQSAAPTMAPSGGGSNIPSGSKVASGTSVTFTAAAAAADYRFLGWYDAAEGGNQLSSSTTYTTTINAATTVYAQYAKLVITWQNNMLGAVHATSNPSGGVVAALPATNPSSCNSTLYPTFCGWSATEPSGGHWNKAPDYITTSTAVTADVTYYAVFKHATNNYWYTQCPTFYTLTFQAGTGSGSDYVVYTDNTTYTLPNAATTGHSKSGYALSGWTANVAVTVGGSSVAAGTFIARGAHISGISGDITFTAVWTGNIAISGNIWLTSYNGVEVYATSTTSNLITVSSADATGATRYKIIYLDGSGSEVSKGSSRFRLCNNGSSNYNKVDVSSDYVNISTTGEYSQTYSISYTPNEHGTLNNGSLKLQLLNGSDVLSEATLPLHGRALPEEFVVASKFGGEWYALPNTLETTEVNAKAVAGVRIIVDNTTTPTEATYAPDITVYKGKNRYATANAYGIRLTNNGTNCLQVSTTDSKNVMWLSPTGSAKCEDWWLQSSDFGAYSVTLPSNTGNESKKIGMYGGNIGYYASPTSPSDEIYFLPIINKLVDNPASVTEWGKKSVILDVDAQSPIAGAQARLGSGAAETAASFGETKTSVKAGATKYNYTLTFTTTDFSAHKGELLYVDWLDGSDNVISTSTITIPWIIAESGTMSTIDATKGHWDTEVHVLPGVTLTANGGSFGSNTVVVKQLEIYPGATVKVTTGTLDVTDLVLRNGWTRAGEKACDVARLYITPSSASMTTTRAYADWYIDYDQYYPIAVPWTVTTSGMSYLNSNNAASAGVKMRYYDGAERADISTTISNWKEYSVGDNAYPATLTPGVGYAMTARRPSGKAFSIIRMPMSIPSAAWTAGGEQGEVSGTHKDQVTVTGYGVGVENVPWYAKGWNFIANPYMAIFNTNDAGVYDHIAYQDGSSVRYVTIPDIDFKNYDQLDVTTATIKPASGFFIQAKDAGAQTITFVKGKIVPPSIPALLAKAEETIPEQDAYIRLSYEGGKDQMGLIIADEFTAEYEVNADLAKILGESNFVKTYMRYGDMDMAYLAINGTLAKEWIPVTVRIPEASEYTFSLTNSSVVGELDGIYLIDYGNGSKVTNLIERDYVFTAEEGTLTDRFSINAAVSEHKTPTSIEAIGGEIDGDKPIKFIYQDKMFIRYQGVIYDATGKKVKEINK